MEHQKLFEGIPKKFALVFDPEKPLLAHTLLFTQSAAALIKDHPIHVVAKD